MTRIVNTTAHRTLSSWVRTNINLKSGGIVVAVNNIIIISSSININFKERGRHDNGGLVQLELGRWEPSGAVQSVRRIALLPVLVLTCLVAVPSREAIRAASLRVRRATLRARRVRSAERELHPRRLSSRMLCTGPVRV